MKTPAFEIEPPRFTGFVNDSLARGLRKQSIPELVERSRRLENEIWSVWSEITQKVAAGVPPAKVAQQSAKKIEDILDRGIADGIVGKLLPFTKRKYGYIYTFASLEQQALQMRVLLGDINGRSQLKKPDEIFVAMITNHAVERVHKRMNTPQAAIVFLELSIGAIYSLNINLSARRLGLKAWPVPSLSGFFVAVPGGFDSATAAFVTWISYKRVEEHWRVIVDPLLESLKGNIFTPNTAAIDKALQNCRKFDRLAVESA